MTASTSPSTVARPSNSSTFPTIPYSAPMESYLLPDEAKILTAVEQVLGSAAVV